jgi:putative tricarboxylic transport membrane protein
METPSSPQRGVSVRSMEMAVALGFLGFSAAVIVDSIRVGRGWGADGPEAGFYPFYVALLLGVAAGSILVREWRSDTQQLFVGSRELGRVLAVLLPSAAYIVLVLSLGIYVASALFLVGFMRLQGKYAWSRALLLGVSVPLIMFALFELGFALPLPKGPVEGWLGY